MPWFPEFYSAVELARRETRADGRDDPVGLYFAALHTGDTRALETVWPGHVLVFDPRAGEIHGHRQLRRFVRQNQAWLAERRARIEMIAATRTRGRAVVEMLAHLDGGEQDMAWPVAVVAESSDDFSVVFRTYCSQWPVDGRRHVRPPILAGAPVHPAAVVEQYLAALESGDADAIVTGFAADGYVREPVGLNPNHRGPAELHSFFAGLLTGGGIGLERCAVTDDGVRCALEYNCIRWGVADVPPQAGLAVYERAADGLLAAVRIYDDVEQPFGRS